MPHRGMLWVPGVLLGLALCAVGCRQKMADQPRYEPYEPNHFFDDSLTVRTVPEGTIARDAVHLYRQPTRPGREESAQEAAGAPRDAPSGEAARDPEAPGGGAAGSDAWPFPLTEDVLARGRQQYLIYCSPCHGRVGGGRGMIVQRGFRAPPSFHTDRLRQAPPSHFYEVITNGFGAMYSYRDRVAPSDRWAIAAYIRALQLSQHARLEDVPADQRNELNATRP